MREQNFDEETPLIGDGSTSATPDTIADRQWEKKKRSCLVALIVGVFVIAARGHSVNGSSYVKNLLKNGEQKRVDYALHWVAKDPTQILGVCEGDCDSDNNCKGNLKCWDHRVETGDVPGCSGSGKPGYDYCYDPKRVDYVLHWVAKDPTRILEVCEGDCDSDNRCKGDLKCWDHRVETGDVPGCGGSRKPGYDYCYEPPKRLDYALHWVAKKPTKKLAVCEGNCDSDYICEGDLKCWGDHRVETGDVPGCSGSGKPGYDYCYDPKRVDYTLHWVAKDPSYRLAVCEGDCDSDNNCEGDLKCWDHRVETGDVPGCSGSRKPGYDYCYEPPKDRWVCDGSGCSLEKWVCDGSGCSFL